MGGIIKSLALKTLGVVLAGKRALPVCCEKCESHRMATLLLLLWQSEENDLVTDISSFLYVEMGKQLWKKKKPAGVLDTQFMLILNCTNTWLDSEESFAGWWCVEDSAGHSGERERGYQTLPLQRPFNGNWIQNWPQNLIITDASAKSTSSARIISHRFMSTCAHHHIWKSDYSRISVERLSKPGTSNILFYSVCTDGRRYWNISVSLMLRDYLLILIHVKILR